MVDLKEKNMTTSVDNEKPTIPLERKAKFVFNKCCFCIPLKTGCLVLAYLFLVGNVVSGLWTTVGIVEIAMFLSKIPGVSILIIILMINIASVVLDLVSVAFNIFLLVGLHKERQKYVKKFLTFQLVYIILNVLKHIFIFFYGYTRVIFIAIALASDALNIYYLFAIRSQYVKMGEAIDKLPSQVYRDGRVEVMP